MNRLQELQKAGVSIWLDTLSRELLETGEFAELVRDFLHGIKSCELSDAHAHGVA